MSMNKKQVKEYLGKTEGNLTKARDQVWATLNQLGRYLENHNADDSTKRLMSRLNSLDLLLKASKETAVELRRDIIETYSIE